MMTHKTPYFEDKHSINELASPFSIGDDMTQMLI
jgi:hypothetical protein